MTRVAVYARVSTDDKDQDPETQLHHLRKVADAHGHDIVAEYVDEASGRTVRGRKAYQDMMAAAAKGRFEAIMTYRLDRLHRNTAEAIVFADQLRTMGIDLVITSQGIDTSTAMGRFFWVIVAAYAELESATTSERVKLGMDRVKAEGGLYHRPQIELSPYMLAKAKDLIAANPGISGRELAANYKGISRPTLLRRLTEAGLWPPSGNQGG